MVEANDKPKPVSALDETIALPAPAAAAPKPAGGPSSEDPTCILSPSEAGDSSVTKIVPPPEAKKGSARSITESDTATLITTAPTGSRDGRRSTRMSSFEVPEDAERIGPYLIMDEVARGGMGIVYRAFHPDLNKVVALKVLIAGEHASIELLERFRREVQAAAKLPRHPHIVQVFDAGQTRELHYFTMDFVAGRSLAQAMLEESHRLTPRRAAEVLEKVARALQHAHDHGVIHRDLKPHNVLLDGAGQPYLTDFGLAKDTEHDLNLTEHGAILGSPPYMSPEQARGEVANINKRSDVYGLGATLYYALTAQAPFEAKTAFATIQKVIEKDAAPPSSIVPGLHRDLETICAKAMEKDPSRRYESPAALADDLKAFLEGRAITARPPTFGERFWRGARRRPELSAAAIVLVLAAIAALFYELSRPALLDLVTEPSGASLIVDGTKIGETPIFGFELPAGRHELRAELEDYLPLELGELSFARGRTTSYRLPLVSARGTLLVTATPANARVRVARVRAEDLSFEAWESAWQDPPFITELPAGPSYIIEATAQGYPTLRSEPIRLEPGRKLVEKQVDLSILSGTLALRGQPVGASIAVDVLPSTRGAAAGLGLAAGAAWETASRRPVIRTTLPPPEVLRLPAGSYRLRAEHPDGLPLDERFEIVAKNSRERRVDLAPRRLWTTEIGACPGAGLRVIDLNGDGVPDFLIDRPSSGLLAVSGDDGRALPLAKSLAAPGLHLLTVLKHWIVVKDGRRLLGFSSG